MTRIMRGFVFAMSLALVASVASAADDAAPKKVACIGDSITYGARIRNRNVNSYPAQLGRMLGEGYSVSNFGVSGATLLKKGNKPYWRQRAFGFARKSLPDVVVIKLGTNDTKPANWKHSDSLVDDYVEMVKTFQGLDSKPKVFICYPVPVFPEQWGINDKAVREGVIPAVNTVAEKTGAGIIDLYAPLKEKSELFPDKVHPNAEGAKIIAETVARAIMSTGASTAGQVGQVKDIKSYCLDYNWGGRRRFARPGSWKDADPAQHIAWYKAMGVNVIQTFCVSCNGYAWYKNGFIPEQPGLKHDFLPEMVKLGHAEGMMVMGYFCIASNPKWAKDHPDLSYGAPATYHIPYTDEYLDYLSKSIADAVTKTGIDGFMIDWLWQPRRQSTGGKWLDCEKKLYKQLMGSEFPGEAGLSKQQDLAYSRKAIDRCWKAIRKAAKDANPNCIVWVTTNHMDHPHVVNSDMYREADWLMNESGDMRRIQAVKKMVGKHTRLITCLARWNRADATKVVPEALEAGVGLYGFTKPRTGGGLVPLEGILSRPVGELRGDDRNIAVLARAYHGVPVAAKWNGKDGFEAP